MADGISEHGGDVDQSPQAARVVVPLLIDMYSPTSVLDVGCGLGGWAAEFAKTVPEVVGVDSDPGVEIPGVTYHQADLSEELLLGRRFDLTICLEVGEHLQDPTALMQSLTRTSDRVVFSAAIPGQGGPGHVHERWQSWWADRFAELGYGALDVIRPAVAQNPDVWWWYRQNMLVYEKDAPIVPVEDWAVRELFEGYRTPSLSRLPGDTWRRLVRSVKASAAHRLR